MTRSTLIGCLAPRERGEDGVPGEFGGEEAEGGRAEGGILDLGGRHHEEDIAIVQRVEGLNRTGHCTVHLPPDLSQRAYRISGS